MLTRFNARKVTGNSACHSAQAHFNELQLNKTIRDGLTQIITSRVVGQVCEYYMFINNLYLQVIEYNFPSL